MPPSKISVFEEQDALKEALSTESPDQFIYEEIGTQIGRLVKKKNAAYGNSFEKSCDMLKILYPRGVSPEQYEDLLPIVRIIDKLFRIATSKDALGESPYSDIAGYGILGVAKANTKRIDSLFSLAREGKDIPREE